MRNITARHYTSVPGITDDYFAVRKFLIKHGHSEFTYGRWDWMATHLNLEKESLPLIGLWEDSGEVVALAVFDCQPGETYLLTAAGYEELMPELIRYAGETLCTNEYYSLVIPDNNCAYQNAAAALGYVATPEKELEAALFPAETATAYTLPEGFHITDMSKTFDMFEYGKVLWNGFENDGEYAPTAEDEEAGNASMLRPSVDLSLKIAVVAPNGEFAAYCGMWYDKDADYAVIEPVACDPKYRRLGLARAAVLEGIARTARLGASYAAVVSSQQFYYSIGLKPFMNSTKWVKRGQL